MSARHVEGDNLLVEDRRRWKGVRRARPPRWPAAASGLRSPTHRRSVSSTGRRTAPSAPGLQHSFRIDSFPIMTMRIARSLSGASFRRGMGWCAPGDRGARLAGIRSFLSTSTLRLLASRSTRPRSTRRDRRRGARLLADQAFFTGFGVGRSWMPSSRWCASRARLTRPVSRQRVRSSRRCTSFGRMAARSPRAEGACGRAVTCPVYVVNAPSTITPPWPHDVDDRGLRRYS